MKKALIVGGDTVEQVRRRLAAQGYQAVDHWEGRKSGDCRRAFPQHVDLVVVMLAYVSHNLVRRVRQQAARNDWQIEYHGRRQGVAARSAD